MTIEIPAFDDPERQDEVIEAINEFAARLIAPARKTTDHPTRAGRILHRPDARSR